ncbi:hypothetical protein [Ottowia caeni]|uniref:hypothetical protein n=1 Tax=Ottowia caeni TaxID=2870339 RepID=UPI003D754812
MAAPHSSFRRLTSCSHAEEKEAAQTKHPSNQRPGGNPAPHCGLALRRWRNLYPGNQLRIRAIADAAVHAFV